MKTGVITKTLLASLTLFVLAAPKQASAQLIPQPWVSVGAQDGEVTYAVGAKAFDFGVELGRGPDDSTGVDVLKFFSLPVVSPYAGVGLYSADKGVSWSGGLQVNTADRVFVGVGYNSVRGVNGQLGVKF
jgi:opacity protein-like surface antigen